MPIVSSHYAFAASSTSVDEKSVRKHTLKWIIVTNDNTLTGLQVLVAGRQAMPHPLPDLFDSYPGDLDAICKGLSATQRNEAPLVWDIEASYDSNYDTEGKKDPNPLLQKPVYNVEFQQFQKVFQKDVNNKLICNTLQQVLVPAQEGEDSRPTLVVKKNFQSLAQIVPLMMDFKDAINDRPFYGAARHQAKIKSITAEDEQTSNGIRHIPVTIRIEFQGVGQTWDRVLLNTSTMFYASATDVPGNGNIFASPLTNKIQGIPVTEPQPIDEKGVLIPRDPNTGQLTKDPIYRTFQIFPERNFGLLNI